MEIKVNRTITETHIDNAKRVLADNGVDPGEAGIVLEALLYVLLDIDADCGDGLDGYEIGSGCDWSTFKMETEYC